jgi:hypothetical protein
MHANRTAGIAQLGERQTEDLKVPGSIPGHGIILLFSLFLISTHSKWAFDAISLMIGRFFFFFYLNRNLKRHSIVFRYHK